MELLCSEHILVTLRIDRDTSYGVAGNRGECIYQSKISFTANFILGFVSLYFLFTSASNRYGSSPFMYKMWVLISFHMFTVCMRCVNLFYCSNMVCGTLFIGITSTTLVFLSESDRYVRLCLMCCARKRQMYFH